MLIRQFIGILADFCCSLFTVAIGEIQVHLLKNPSRDEFRTALDTLQPNIVFLQGEQLPNDEVGSLVWEGLDLSSEEAISGLFGAKLPTTVTNLSLTPIFWLLLSTSFDVLFWFCFGCVLGCFTK